MKNTIHFAPPFRAKTAPVTACGFLLSEAKSSALRESVTCPYCLINLNQPRVNGWNWSRASRHIGSNDDVEIK